MVLFNFSVSSSQLLPDVTKEGLFLVTQDPKKYPSDSKYLPGQWKNLVYVASILTPEEKTALLTLLGLDNAALTKLVQDNSVDTVSLSDIPIGAVDDAQRSRLRNALQLVNDAPVIKGFLADDRQKIIYYGGNLYGVKRLLYSDLSSTNQRPGYEGSNEARPINGTGNANFDNASNQYFTMFFAARNVFSIKLRHTNNNWANRSLAINYTVRNLTASSGSYTFSFLPASGWQSISRLQLKDDGGNTSLDDLQVLYSDSVVPTLMNGQVLIPGDFFKVENDQQVLRFEGVDSASGSWKAVPVSNNLQVDSALNSISTNALQNRVIVAALEELRRTLGDRIDSINLVDQISTYINRQLLANALMIDRLQVLFDEIEQIKERIK